MKSSSNFITLKLCMATWCRFFPSLSRVQQGLATDGHRWGHACWIKRNAICCSYSNGINSRPAAQDPQTHVGHLWSSGNMCSTPYLTARNKIHHRYSRYIIVPHSILALYTGRLFKKCGTIWPSNLHVGRKEEEWSWLVFSRCSKVTQTHSVGFGNQIWVGQLSVEWQK